MVDIIIKMSNNLRVTADIISKAPSLENVRQTKLGMEQTHVVNVSCNIAIVNVYLTAFLRELRKKGKA